MDKLTFYAPIEKTNDEQRMVYGYASTEALDSQGEIVKKEALASAIDEYMKWANIREMHQPSAVGKTKRASIDKKGLYIAAKIVDEVAWEKVKEGVYNGFSIGGRVGVMKDNEITSMTLSEISLVDRPANPECKIDVYKMEDKPVEPPKEEPKVEEVKPVVTTTSTDVVVEIKPVEVPTAPATVEQAVVEAKEKVSKPDLIKLDDICTKEEIGKIENVEVKKCLEYVGELAYHLNSLHNMEERYEMEGEYNGTDPKSEAEYKLLVESLKSLGETLKALANKAVEDMNKEEVEEKKETPAEVKVEEPVVVKSEEPKLEVAEAKEEAKVEDSKLAKVEADLSALKEQFAKLQDYGLPIKAKASYVTVEKFEGDTTGNELHKAETRMEELSQILKFPHDVSLEKEAKDLSLTVMRLRREKQSGNH